MSKFFELLPKILSEAFLCLAVFSLHCFIEDQVETYSEEGSGLNFVKIQASSRSWKKLLFMIYLFLFRLSWLAAP